MGMRHQAHREQWNDADIFKTLKRQVAQRLVWSGIPEVQHDDTTHTEEIRKKINIKSAPTGRENRSECTGEPPVWTIDNAALIWYVLRACWN